MLNKLLRALRECKLLSARRGRGAYSKIGRKIISIENICVDIAEKYDEDHTPANAKVLKRAEDAIIVAQGSMGRQAYRLNTAQDILGMLFSED